MDDNQKPTMGGQTNGSHGRRYVSRWLLEDPEGEGEGEPDRRTHAGAHMGMATNAGHARRPRQRGVQ
jgi:hypothetical protein